MFSGNTYNWIVTEQDAPIAQIDSNFQSVMSFEKEIFNHIYSKQVGSIKIINSPKGSIFISDSKFTNIKSNKASIIYSEMTGKIYVSNFNFLNNDDLGDTMTMEIISIKNTRKAYNLTLLDQIINTK